MFPTSKAADAACEMNWVYVTRDRNTNTKDYQIKRLLEGP